jgi:alpha-mannosidase
MQFHDILPGTAIAWVYREVENRHAQISQELREMIGSSLALLANDASSNAAASLMRANSTPASKHNLQALSIGAIENSAEPAKIADSGELTVIDNGILRVSVDRTGRVTSLVSLSNNREAIAPGIPANEFQMHKDNPTRWDAWDVDENYRNTKVVLDQVDEFNARIEDGTAVIETKRQIASPGRPKSTIIQTLRLEPGANAIEIGVEVDWHESEKFLKLAFPIDIHAEEVAAETQFGFVKRPTHINTSWDFARFELSQHKYLFLEERGWGIAFANDSTYGFDVQRNTESNGATVTNVRFSLLRAPKFPDPEADQGLHSMRFKIRPAATIQDAVHLGYDLNTSATEVLGNREVEPLVTSSASQVIIETVKLAEDASGDLIVRLYESTGSRCSSRIGFAGYAESIALTDFLEEPISTDTAQGSSIELDFRPFQVVTLRVSGLKIG